MLNRFPILISMFALASMALAQRPARTLSSKSLDIPIGASSVVVESGGVVHVHSKATSGSQAWSLVSGAVAPGSFDVLGPTVLGGLLIAGRNGAGQGVVEHWVYAPLSGVWTLASSRTMPGADFTGVAFSGTTLYLLDCVTHTVLAAPWSPSQQLSAAVLQVWVGTAEVSVLAESDSLQMRFLSPLKSPGIPGAGIFLFGEEQLRIPIWGDLVRDSGSGILVSAYCHNPRPALANPVIDRDGFIDGTASVGVVASGGDSVEVLDSTYSVIGAGVAPVGGGLFPISLSQVIQTGLTYHVRKAGSQFLDSGLGIRRHGFPETFTSGESLTKIPLAPATYRLGNSGFTFYCELKRPQAISPAIDYIGVIVVGFGGYPIIPFDNGQGINQALVTEYWFGVTGFLNQNERRGFVKWEFPLPSDPSFEGLELLAQFGIIDAGAGGAFRLSEVVGFKLLAQ
jgi:hypothetical protein